MCGSTSSGDKEFQSYSLFRTLHRGSEMGGDMWRNIFVTHAGALLHPMTPPDRSTRGLLQVGHSLWNSALSTTSLITSGPTGFGSQLPSSVHQYRGVFRPVSWNRRDPLSRRTGDIGSNRRTSPPVAVAWLPVISLRLCFLPTLLLTVCEKSAEPPHRTRAFFMECGTWPKKDQWFSGTSGEQKVGSVGSVMLVVGSVSFFFCEVVLRDGGRQ